MGQSAVRNVPSGTCESGGGIPASERGFTLLELMITIAIAAILLAVGIPSYRSFIQNSRASALATEITAAMNTARAEAVKRSEAVRVCPSSDGSSCTGAWEDGWIVQRTINNEVLQVWQARSASDVIVQTPTDNSAIVFNRLGGLDSADTTVVVRAVDCTGDSARQIDISPTGRQRISRQACP
jgi:type IV fimbrial biogenesis protein FimT